MKDGASCWSCRRRTPRPPASRRRSGASSARRASWRRRSTQFTRLVDANASEAERGQALTYRPGDVIQFHQNAKGGFTKASG